MCYQNIGGRVGSMRLGCGFTVRGEEFKWVGILYKSGNGGPSFIPALLHVPRQNRVGFPSQAIVAAVATWALPPPPPTHFTSAAPLFTSVLKATWAKLYYRSCTSLDGLLGEKEGGACPVRVMGVSGKWFWEGSREAFIR